MSNQFNFKICTRYAQIQKQRGRIYVSDRLGKSVCVCFLISEVVIIEKGEIVEAKLHDESRLIHSVLMIT